MDLYNLLGLLGIGLLAGFATGVFGIGGGSVRIPLLNLVGIPLTVAFGINLVVVPVSSLVGAVSQRVNIDWRFAWPLIVGGSIGSVAGAVLVGAMSTLTLAIIFVTVAIITVAGIYLGKLAPRAASRLHPTRRLVFSGSVLLNFVSGMRGGSGGSLFPPFLTAIGLPVHSAIASSLFATIFTALGAIAVYWHRGDIDWVTAGVVTAGSVLGTRVGSLVSLRTKPVWLEAGLSLLVVLLATITVVRAL